MPVSGCRRAREPFAGQPVFLTQAGWGVGLAVLASLARAEDGHDCRPRYYVDPQLAGEVSGVYPLSNGQLLRVSRELRRFYADMPATGRIEIVPVDEDVFVQRNGPVRLAFEREAFASDVVVRGLGGRASGPPACR